MDLAARKLSLIEEFLNVQNEDVLSKIEHLLHSKSSSTPFSKEELNARANLSMQDSKAGNLTDNDDLIEEIKSWG